MFAGPGLCNIGHRVLVALTESTVHAKPQRRGGQGDDRGTDDHIRQSPAQDQAERRRHRARVSREHRIPLGDAAMEVVKQMATVRSRDHVFPGTGGEFCGVGNGRRGGAGGRAG